ASAGAPTAAEVSVPSLAVPRGLSRLASAAEAALGADGPVAPAVVEQAAHLVGGQAAAELVVAHGLCQPAVARLVVELPVAHEPYRLAAVVPPADHEPSPPAAALPAVVRPVAREPYQLAAVVPLADREPSPPVAVLPAVARLVAEQPVVRGTCPPAAVPKADGRYELVEPFRLAQPLLADWSACSLVHSPPVHSAARWAACSLVHLPPEDCRADSWH